MEKIELQLMMILPLSSLLSGAIRCRMSHSPQDFDDPMEVDLSADTEPAQLNLALLRSDSAFDTYHHRSSGITVGEAARFQVRARTFFFPDFIYHLFSVVSRRTREQSLYTYLGWIHFVGLQHQVEVLIVRGVFSAAACVTDSKCLRRMAERVSRRR
jgi:hypothetical protein